jgi:cell division protein FtsA
MRYEHIIVGLDIGTSSIKTIVGQKRKEEERPLIIGLGITNSAGLRKGAVVDIEETIKAINSSIEKAEQSAGIPIENAYVSIGGDHILSQFNNGVVAVSRADGEISQEDVSRAVGAAQALSLPANREIIHIIPTNFTVDNQEQIKDPIGMTGVRLEVNALIIHGLTPFIKNLSKCVTETGLDINDLVISSLSASEAVLSSKQKELGAVVIDIGAGTTGISVFEEGNIIHCAVIPMGANHITNDVAIGLRTSINVAEQVKKDFGSAVADEVNKKDKIDLSQIDEAEEEIVSRHYLAEIIEARLSEIFSLVDEELKKINRSRLLPAGAVLTGGGAKMSGIVDLAKKELGLPCEIGFPKDLEGIVDKINDPSFATAVGLVMWGENSSEARGGLGRFLPSSLPNFLPSLPSKEIFHKIKKFGKSLLP